MTRFVCVSDTHGMLKRINVPPGDVLIHAGDLSRRGTLRELEAEYEVLNQMPHERVVVTPGNHDFGLQDENNAVHLGREYPRVQTLIGAASTVAGVRIWGDPWTPWFYDWAFNFSPGRQGEREAAARYATIPDDVQLLVTHGPPRGILDEQYEHGSERRSPVGSIALRERIRSLRQLRAHVFGHIHCGYGALREDDVWFVNASSCTEQDQPTNPPIVMDWDGERFEVVEDGAEK